MKNIHAHKLIASTAANCAAELYETLMSNNQLYDAWKKSHPGAGEKGLRLAFVAKYTSGCLGIARATLARLLESPTISDEHKETIMEALELDASLMMGRKNPAEIVGTAPTDGE